MDATRTREIASTTLALSSVVLMLLVARNAGVRGAAPTAIVVAVGAAILGIGMIAGVMRILGKAVPQETCARLMMETAGMLAVTTPIVLVAAVATGWVV